MVDGVSSAISALQSIGKKLNVSANNIANSNTTGFKKSSASSTDVSHNGSGGGTVLSEISESASQGALVPTESPTDLAISGNGYFVLSGDNGETYYTRDGGFDFDDEGNLVDDSGNTVQGWALNSETGEISGGIGDITLSGEFTSVSVGSDGVISGVDSNGDTVGLFQIAVANFTNTDGLENIGGNLYTATSESGEAVMGTAGAGGLGSIVSNALEGSNVDLAEEFVNLTLLQRSYEANLKVFQAEDEMKGDVLDIIS